MLKSMILMMLMSWPFSLLGMQLDLQKKLDFQAVATHLGFNIQHIIIQYVPFENTTFASQGFGAGWILLRMNPSGQFKIISCTADLGEIKDNYYQSEWLSFAQALAYAPDLQPFLIANDLLEYMKREEIKDAMSKKPN